MIVREQVPLALHTTLKVGGEATFFIEAYTIQDVKDALDFALTKSLPFIVLGGGANVLAPDSGLSAVVCKISIQGIALEDFDENVLVTVGAGESWDALVSRMCTEGLLGMENLAGIPGTVGGATVQNIGAYGAELSNIFHHAEVVDRKTGESLIIGKDKTCFGYRDSVFKECPNYIITSITFLLVKKGEFNLAYPDLEKTIKNGASFRTPRDVAQTVRQIRSNKFPDLQKEGTAGSFFKNPIISACEATSLQKFFQGLPCFAQEDGTVKVSLAWILDHVLCMRGHAHGFARLYEKQPLVVVTSVGATSADVEALSNEVSECVKNKTGINIIREVVSL